MRKGLSAKAIRPKLKVPDEVKFLFSAYYGMGGFSPDADEMSEIEHKLMIRRYEKFLDDVLDRASRGEIPDRGSLVREISTTFQHAVKRGLEKAGFTAELPEGFMPKLYQLANEAAEEESKYLERFLRQVANGEVDQGHLEARKRMYLNTVDGVEAHGFLSVLPEDALVYWELSPFCKHCPDCLALAEGSPYRVGDLHIVPRDGHTQCLSNCKCHLRVVGIEERIEKLGMRQSAVIEAPKGTPDDVFDLMDRLVRQMNVAVAKARAYPSRADEFYRIRRQLNAQLNELISRDPALRRVRRRISTSEWIRRVDEELKSGSVVISSVEDLVPGYYTVFDGYKSLQAMFIEPAEEGNAGFFQTAFRDRTRISLDDSLVLLNRVSDDVLERSLGSAKRISELVDSEFDRLSRKAAAEKAARELNETTALRDAPKELTFDARYNYLNTHRYFDVNMYMRGRRKLERFPHEAAVRRVIRSIRKLFDLYSDRKDEDFVVFRGYKDDDKGTMQQLIKNAGPGFVVKEEGVTSVSLSSFWAKHMSGAESKKRSVVFRILVPKRTRFLWGTYISRNKGEYEILFEPGTRFVVLGSKMMNKYTMLVDAILVPSKP